MPDLVWRVLTVSAGAYGSHQLTGISKIVKTIITPLADFQVSVLVISTYQSDYVLVGLEPLGSLVLAIKSNPALQTPHHYRQFVPWCGTNADCRVADCQVNKENLFVECFNRLPIPKF